MSVAGCALLVTLAALRGNAWHIVACSLYGASLIALYSASTIYHAVCSRRWKRVWRVVDHSAIYLLIAGSYTPFTLVSLRGAWGWSLFGVVWGLTLIGILFKVWFVDRVPVISTIVYLLMGWLVIVAVKPLFAAVPHAAIAWLAASGLLYTTGVAFFAWQRLPYHHAIWHAFVLAGSVCHYVAVLYYVIPAKLPA